MSASSSSAGRLDPNHQVRRPALRCEERIDLAGLANQGDVGFHTRCNRFQEGHIRRAGQMPVFGIPDNEIEDRFVLRQDDYGGMAAFLTNVEAFLSEVCKQELRIDFATLSLVNAIGHRRTQNWLEKARESLRSEHYTESVAHSAAAMAIYLHHRDTRRGERVDPSYLIDSSSSKLGDVVDWILEYVEPIRARLDLVSHGIDVVLYDKFEALTPETSIGRDGVVTEYGLKSKTASSREDARFCYTSL